VLEPFRRGRGARYEGSGLGLPIVAAIAAAHGGRVDVESELGEGTRVTLILPVDGPREED
jgi:signal transduction histidine kinase